MAADVIEYEIEGDASPLLTVRLDPGEAVQAEAGALVMMDSGIAMSTEMPGSLMGSLFRKLSGETFFASFFTNESNSVQSAGFASPMPGQIKAVDLAATDGVFCCQRGAYLCSARGIEISIALTKRWTSGLFGGEGLVLQKLTGDGLAFVSAGGTLVERQLKDGQTLTVGTGNLVGFSGSCQYEIRMQRGVRNLLFGGEGLFLTEITGPGLVLIQTQPLAALALALHRLMPESEKE